MKKDKIKFFLSKIKYEDSSIIDNILSTLTYMYKVDKDHADKTMDALIAVATNAKLEFVYDSYFHLEQEDNVYKICFSKSFLILSAVHELEHVIYGFCKQNFDVIPYVLFSRIKYNYGIIDEVFDSKLSELVKDVNFVRKFNFITDEISFIKKKCSDLVTSTIDRYEENKELLNTDISITEYMKETNFNDDEIEFVRNSCVSKERFIKTLTIIKNTKVYSFNVCANSLFYFLYPGYYHLYIILHDIDAYYGFMFNNKEYGGDFGHSTDYFDYNHDLLFNELVATYEEIRLSGDDIKVVMNYLFGEDISLILSSYADFNRELILNNIKRNYKLKSKDRMAKDSLKLYKKMKD